MTGEAVDVEKAASMGPSAVADGETAIAGGKLSQGDASMGPSAVADGEVVFVHVDERHAEHASMGPSAVADGEERGEVSAVRHVLGFNGAVGGSRRRAPTASIAPRPGSRFNGAVGGSRRRGIASRR